MSSISSRQRIQIKLQWPKTNPPRSLAQTSNRNISKKQIRMRAFELYEERGCGDGRELEDWVRAEVEITNGQAKGKAA